MTKVYTRPLDFLEGGRASRALDAGKALPLAGGPIAFQSVEILSRDGSPQVVPACDFEQELKLITGARRSLGGLSFEQPQVMGILNVTPDSFSDGGDLDDPQQLIDRARTMEDHGAAIWDVGGESTRPGSDTVAVDEELTRVIPAIEALAGLRSLPVSVDSRKPEVFAAAIAAGATFINDVSALTYSDASLGTASACAAPVILMHAQGDPKTMQESPQYGDVLLDVYDWLEARIEACEAAGIRRETLLVDPGIGFGKTGDDNLRLLGGLSLFHGLGCPVLLGASRKSFIHKITPAPDTQLRIGGSLAAVEAGRAQGVQVFRVHDVFETVQALTISAAIARFS